MLSLSECRICPRRCGADRYAGRGRCGAGADIEISHVMLHHWEEPVISGGPGEKGSGAVFLTHCPLGCVYCQNGRISSPASRGKSMTPSEAAGVMLELQSEGAYNINLVSPTQYAPQLIEAVRIAREQGLSIPVVWNTGGYELPEIIEELQGTADVFLTDMKYSSEGPAARYSRAPDYPETAVLSLKKMVETAGPPVTYESPDGTELLGKGVIVRHLVIPSLRKESERVLETVAEAVGTENVILSLMAQYTPDFLKNADRYHEIGRRITSFEYDSVLEKARGLGFKGFSQDRSSAVRNFTPDF